MTTGRINQVTASVLTGPGGPHRRASVGRDTTPCFRYRGALAPDGYVFASPAERTSTSPSIARMPPARAGSADARDNLVIDCANSALWFYETCRRLRTARVRLSMAASAVKTKTGEDCYLRRL